MDSDVMKPWDILREPLFSGFLRHVELRGGAAPPSVEGVLYDMLGRSPQSVGNRPLRLYALIDGARTVFLPERLEASGLLHVCLYNSNDLEDGGAAAPWLVELDPTRKFTRSVFACDLQGQNPRALFGMGIWLTSHYELADLRAHLRHYTKLVDEYGATEYFRLAEPGMLDALFCASGQPEAVSFFRIVSQIVYPWPELQPDQFSILSVTSAAPVEPSGSITVPRITPRVRQALEDFVTDRQSRRMALRLLPDPADRAVAYPVFARLLRAGFNHERRLLQSYELLRHIPNDGHRGFWAEVEGGNQSLRRILLVYRDHYGIEGVLQ